MGGWHRPLPTIFGEPPTPKWLESPSKTKGNQGKARKSQKGNPYDCNWKAKALQPGNGWQDPVPTTLKMSSTKNKHPQNLEQKQKICKSIFSVAFSLVVFSIRPQASKISQNIRKSENPDFPLHFPCSFFSKGPFVCEICCFSFVN